MAEILSRISRALANRVGYGLHRAVNGKRACRSYAEFLLNAFDRRHGIETTEWVQFEALALDGPNGRFGNWYMPADPSALGVVLRSLGIDPRGHVFVDLGSGKGRMLVAASEAGFRRAIGVEYSPVLHAVAGRNVARYRETSRSACAIETVHGDAALYEFPPEPLVIFFFNSFMEPVLTPVLGNLGRSLADHPRDAYVLRYGTQYYPELTRVFEATPFLKLVEATENLAVYRAAPPQAS